MNIRKIFVDKIMFGDNNIYDTIIFGDNKIIIEYYLEGI